MKIPDVIRLYLGGFTIAVSVVFTPMVIAQPCNDPALSELAERARLELDSPAVALMRISDGQVRIGVSGLRDARQTEPVTTDDLWHIGSNTKAMTATLVARLVERGSISWEDTVEQHLGEAINNLHPDYTEVTLRHLLSHYSGVPTNINTWDLMRLNLEGDQGRPLTEQRLDFATRILLNPPQVDPGSTFLYSNAGYVIVGAMLEQATGQPWEELIVREVFAPLGIDEVGFGAPGSVGLLDQPRGHRPGLLGGLVALAGRGADNPPVMGPAATVHISMSDYALFLQAHIDGARGEDSGFLSPENWQILHTGPYEAAYAMGWGVGEDELQHAGSNTLWLIHAVISPDHNMGAVIAMNRAPQTPVESILSEVIRTN
jgi:D-alanyl-D-alanine carboxypeptidase